MAATGWRVLGTTGEANSLGHRTNAWRSWRGWSRAASRPRKMLPGTGTTAMTDTVMLTQHAAEAGLPRRAAAAAVLLQEPSDDGLFAYFTEVIQRVGGDIKHLPVPLPAAIGGAVQPRR